MHARLTAKLVNVEAYTLHISLTLCSMLLLLPFFAVLSCVKLYSTHLIFHIVNLVFQLKEMHCIFFCVLFVPFVFCASLYVASIMLCSGVKVNPVTGH
jgi:hypothetical protein